MSTPEQQAEQFQEALDEMARARADAETRAATAERRLWRGRERVAELNEQWRERLAESERHCASAWANHERFCAEINVIGHEVLGFKVENCAPDAVSRETKALVNSLRVQRDELIEEHRRSLLVFEKLKKWLDDTGLRTNVELVDASIEATRAIIAAAEGGE